MKSLFSFFVLATLAVALAHGGCCHRVFEPDNHEECPNGVCPNEK